MAQKKGLGFCLFPGYRYCGPGCSGPGAPINDVDAACKKHDECFSKYGLSCKCDIQFLRRLKKKCNPYTKKGRQAAILYNYMKFQAAFSCGFLPRKRKRRKPKKKYS
jgi:hypothetical protein